MDNSPGICSKADKEKADRPLFLEMRGIRKSFGSIQALKNGTLELRKGEIVALMGENGAGKTTLMNILQGAVQRDEGSIRLDGTEIAIRSPLAAKSYGISKIHQELQLVPELSVAENMFLGREARNRLGLVSDAGMNRLAEPLLQALDLQVSPRTPVRKLRIGEQQLVEIGKALSIQSRILIMDEPTSALSGSETEKLFQVVRRLSAEGVSIIYISHRMDEIFELTDRITVMRDGEYIGTARTGDTSRDELIHMMVGRNLTELYPSRLKTSGDELLRVERLSYRPGPGSAKKALNDITFTLHRGEVLGIAGLMGSGRTELFECLFGMHPGNSDASLRIKGKRVAISSPAEAIRHGIAFVTEDRKRQGLVLGRSIMENMSLPLLRRFSKWGLLRRKLERTDCEAEKENLKIKAPNLAIHAGSLSGGNQQKVVLGRWLLTKPIVLLLDEPTRGIDVGAKAEIYRLIRHLAAEGLGIVVISSELPEVLGISDRILTFCEGRITDEFLREEATQEKIMIAATKRGR